MLHRVVIPIDGYCDSSHGDTLLPSANRMVFKIRHWHKLFELEMLLLVAQRRVGYSTMGYVVKRDATR
jgi:hypothetical protein